MASFQAKIGCKRQRREEKKLSFRFIPTRHRIENSQKIAKKIKKYRYGFISSQNRLEKAEKERK